MLKVVILAEKFIGKANGVYTAVVETVENLKHRSDIALSVNDNLEKADIIHSHTIGIAYLLKSFGRKSKLIVSAHVVPDSFIGSLILSELWRPLAKWYLKWVYSRARVVVAVSPIVKKELEKIGVQSEIQVLCNSVNREKFKPDPALRSLFRNRFALGENDFIALCVGQIQPRKGVSDFVEVAKRLPQVRFVWVGGRPYGRLTADYDRMTELIQSAPKNVIFTGTAEFEEMPGYYAMADIYFFPSFQENFAFATIEASSVHLPLVLRDNPEYPSTLFTHYLKAKTQDGFVQQIQQLASDSVFFKKWREESNQLASEYDSRSYTQKLVDIYKKVYASASP